jgi:hypothetical protein
VYVIIFFGPIILDQAQNRTDVQLKRVFNTATSDVSQVVSWRILSDVEAFCQSAAGPELGRWHARPVATLRLSLILPAEPLFKSYTRRATCLLYIIIQWYELRACLRYAKLVSEYYSSLRQRAALAAANRKLLSLVLHIDCS